ncbi:MAG TPA: tripartite tricarboxylate transporter substrate binding protein [Negativicutes bacterium]|jgi:tripartite-type tricarboxylate transporter receptor subunit TctC
MEPKAVTTISKYPDRPITIIVPFNAGGSLDMVARALEKTSNQHLGQPIIVVNKPGGGGSIGWNELAAANPDGYTIGITGIEILLQPLYGPTKYNYPTALDPLIQVSSTPMVMVVQANQPWQNIDDLVTYAHQHPELLKFGNAGIGSLTHVYSELFAHDVGITAEPVPFRGSSEALAALLGGHIQVLFTSPATIKEHLKSGTVRALAVTSEYRLTDPVFTDIPTFKEQGVDIVFSYWVGVAAPKEMPVEVKAKLADGLRAIIVEPEFKKTTENLGLQFDYLNPEESQKKWIADNQKLSKIVRETGILDRIKEQRK